MFTSVTQSEEHADNSAKCRVKRREHITPVLASLHWLPVQYRIHFKILVLTLVTLYFDGPF